MTAVEKNNRQDGEYVETADINTVLKEQGLHLRETGFFRKKRTIHRVTDRRGNNLILKTGGIDPFQTTLFRTARHLEKEICFRVPDIVREGNGWVLLEEVPGVPFNNFCDKSPDWFVEMSKKIADSYQTVLRRAMENHDFGDVLIDGEKWLFSRILLWSKPIVDDRSIDLSIVQALRDDFEKSIERKGSEFFGWAHGNIIGDHILVSNDDLFLLDLNVVPRPGKDYYDFLRALDFLFLKTRREEKIWAFIPMWMKNYLSEFDEEEIRLVFAFRMIGILGWDILRHKVEYMKGDIEEKKRMMEKFIRREY